MNWYQAVAVVAVCIIGIWLFSKYVYGSKSVAKKKVPSHDEVIDDILREAIKGPQYSMGENEFNEGFWNYKIALYLDLTYSSYFDNRSEWDNFQLRILERMENENLIKKSDYSQESKELTYFGKEIAERGGWLKHLEKQNVESRRYIINTVLTVIGLLIALYATYTSNRLERDLEKTKIEVDSLSKSKNSTERELENMKTEVDSLSKWKTKMERELKNINNRIDSKNKTKSNPKNQ